MSKRKRALVTGAGRGLGRAVAKALAAEKTDLIVISRTESDLASLAEEAQGLGVSCDAFPADLSDPQSVTSVTRFLSSLEHGPDIVVHNAGGSLRVTDTFAPIEAWQRVWYLNVGAALEINNHCIARMRSRGWGRIVHVASASAFTYSGYSPYVSAKCALIGYVKSVSRVVARDGIVVSAVAPGPLDTPGRYLSEIARESGARWEEYCDNHLSIRRLATTDEVASSIMYLCSDAASYAVGCIMNVDGGTT
jgi:NAD(P)-dependent dehydrogenase (short-subunit alcohol dehydrogenase family)